ncbi:MAG: CTP synthetase [Rhodobacteraceae bacterium]|nr:CTP synthetase [Paracoccaceae bacterium]
MFKLASIIYTIAGVTIAGMLMIITLSAGYDTKEYVVIAVIAGFLLALPVSWYVAKAIKELG